MEDVIKRQMPNSLEAEQSVIGSMIVDRDVIVECSEILIKDDFYHQQYGMLFEAIVELYNAGEPVDEVTLQNKLKEKLLDEYRQKIEDGEKELEEKKREAQEMN